MTVDVAANRRARKWSRRELFGRVLWGLVHPAFRFSPRVLWGWRRMLLRMFGAQIGPQAQIHPTARIMIPWHLRVGSNAAIGDRVIIYSLGQVTIGRNATISQGAHLCAGTHDYRQADMPLVKAAITIGTGVWVCADAFVGPDVVVADYSIVGARAVVMRNVEAWTVVGGNPARFLSRRPMPSASVTASEMPNADR